jgi:trehalose 6-phosphate phosphatase
MAEPLPVPSTPEGVAGLQDLLAHPSSAIIAVDFDGTLAPVVSDPDDARADPAALRALSRLGPDVGTVAVVTGRPAAVAVRYAGLAGTPGLERAVVLGHYGRERWDAASGAVRAPAEDAGVAAARAALPGLLIAVSAPPGTRVEDKGASLAVHTRNAADPAGALELLREPLARLAGEHQLTLEPGRLVLELRPRGMDKGSALSDLVRERQAGSVLYAGDDLGDLAAFDAVEALRDDGVLGITVCSGSEEVSELARRADVVVDGPAGVAALLHALADALAGSHRS